MQGKTAFLMSEGNPASQIFCIGSLILAEKCSPSQGQSPVAGTDVSQSLAMRNYLGSLDGKWVGDAPRRSANASGNLPITWWGSPSRVVVCTLCFYWVKVQEFRW